MNKYTTVCVTCVHSFMIQISFVQEIWYATFGNPVSMSICFSLHVKKISWRIIESENIALLTICPCSFRRTNDGHRCSLCDGDVRARSPLAEQSRASRELQRDLHLQINVSDTPLQPSGGKAQPTDGCVDRCECSAKSCLQILERRFS